MTRLALALVVALLVAAALGAGCVSSGNAASAATPTPAGPGVPYVADRGGTGATVVYVPTADDDEVRFECQTGAGYHYHDGAPGAPVVWTRPLSERLAYVVHEDDAGSLALKYQVEVTVVRGGTAHHYRITF
jgi:hypothetical protein